MSVNFEQPKVIQSMQTAMAAAVPMEQMPLGPAIDSRPIMGKEITIRLALSPGMIALIAAPITVLVTMVLGWMLLKTANLPVYGSEMVAGAIVNTLGGIMAAIPLFILMKRGSAAIAQAGIVAIAVRIGIILMGLLIASAPAWGLTKMPLVYWVMGYYFPLLMTETAVVAWLSNQAKH